MRLNFLTLTVAFLFLLVAAPASSEVFVSSGAGVLHQWNGPTGYEANGSILASVGVQDNWRIGGAFLFREAKTNMAGVRDVGFKSDQIASVTHYRFELNRFVHLYPI